QLQQAAVGLLQRLLRGASVRRRGEMAALRAEKREGERLAVATAVAAGWLAEMTVTALAEAAVTASLGAATAPALAHSCAASSSIAGASGADAAATKDRAEQRAGAALPETAQMAEVAKSARGSSAAAEQHAAARTLQRGWRGSCPPRAAIAVLPNRKDTVAAIAGADGAAGVAGAAGAEKLPADKSVGPGSSAEPVAAAAAAEAPPAVSASVQAASQPPHVVGGDAAATVVQRRYRGFRAGRNGSPGAATCAPESNRCDVIAGTEGPSDTSPASAGKAGCDEIYGGSPSSEGCCIAANSAEAAMPVSSTPVATAAGEAPAGPELPATAATAVAAGKQWDSKPAPTEPAAAATIQGAYRSRRAARGKVVAHIGATTSAEETGPAATAGKADTMASATERQAEAVIAAATGAAAVVAAAAAAAAADTASATRQDDGDREDRDVTSRVKSLLAGARKTAASAAVGAAVSHSEYLPEQNARAQDEAARAIQHRFRGFRLSRPGGPGAPPKKKGSAPAAVVPKQKRPAEVASAAAPTKAANAATPSPSSTEAAAASSISAVAPAPPPETLAAVPAPPL
ncbi:unnamed protein product, partial [Phaeothamnion confervicola]